MVKTEIWVRAHLRRCFASGLTGVIARKGAPEAGSVFVVVARGDDAASLYAPAPGPAFDEAANRRWLEPLGKGAQPYRDVQAYLRRQVNFDPDIWVLEIDDKTGRGLL